jgi:RNA polymerase sigma-70 factor (ECF subfamily)
MDSRVVRVVPRGAPVPVDATALDEATFTALYPALRRFAAVVADHDMEPEDLVQEALTGLLRQPAGRVADVAGYLRRSIVNAAVSQRRRLARARGLQARLVASVPAGERTAYPSDTRAVLDAIPARDRALLYLLEVDGLAVAEAARTLGITTAAAKVRALRARRAARLVLDEGERR